MLTMTAANLIISLRTGGFRNFLGSSPSVVGVDIEVDEWVNNFILRSGIETDWEPGVVLVLEEVIGCCVVEVVDVAGGEVVEGIAEEGGKDATTAAAGGATTGAEAAGRGGGAGET